MPQIPRFKNEDEEREFWAAHDSTDFLEGTEQVTLEYAGQKSPETEVYEEMERRLKEWRFASRFYELYPAVFEAMRAGEHIKEYQKRIEEIARLCRVGG